MPTTLPLPLPMSDSRSIVLEIRWFSATGTVTFYDDRCEVHVGGVLIGRWTPDELGTRNVLMVALSRDPKARQGKLAAAFDVSTETLRRLRKLGQTDGMEAVFARRRGGSQSRVTAAQRRTLHKLFVSGYGAAKAFHKAGKRLGMSQTTIWRVHDAWRRSRGEAPAPSHDGDAAPTAESAQPVLPHLVEVSEENEMNGQPEPPSRTPVEPSDTDEAGPLSLAAEEPAVAASPVHGGRAIQHAGTWLMIAMVAQLGLHGTMARLWPERRGKHSLRVALDALIAALSLGHECVEGVRRVATSTASVLIRASRCPSASWVRRVLRRFIDKAGSAPLHLAMAGHYLESLSSEDGPVVLYVDNHMRPYTGQHVVRLGYRMQDKRARPGITDYYVHDEWGNPLFRVDVPSHDSLVKWLPILARTVRLKYGSSERILLAFDRAGAYPEHFAELRVEGFEFVTYERRPYAKLQQRLFTDTTTLKGQPVGIYEGRDKNLGKGRGRVRRIALRKPDGSQVNLLASSRESAEFLVTVMMRDGGRWVQENAFKHGAERWGLNHLDSYRVTPYPPEAVIPNPARRRLDRALRHSHDREGNLRRKLARRVSDKRRAELEAALADELTLQKHLLLQRPSMPTRAVVADTELAGRLVKHDSHLKTVIDTVRIACINAETELADALRPHLPNPAEAKKALATLFSAPGDVRVTDTNITVRLSPAGTASELHAYNELFRRCDDWRLTLPGDPRRRPLRFRTTND